MKIRNNAPERTREEPPQKKLKTRRKQFPPEIWTVIFKFLQTVKDFRSLYLLNAELHAYSWKQCLVDVRFTYKWSAFGKESDISYVYALDLVKCKYLMDEDLLYFKSVRDLCLKGTLDITNEGLAHLKGIHTLTFYSDCDCVFSDVGLKNLSGIHKLYFGYCDITNDGLGYLKGIHTLKMGPSKITKITNKGLEHLKGISSLEISSAEQITNAGLAYLKGIRSLTLSMCDGISDAGFEHLKGIHHLELSFCERMTDDAFKHLEGIHTLWLFGCPNITGTGFGFLKGARDIGFTECKGISEANLNLLKDVPSVRC